MLTAGGHSIAAMYSGDNTCNGSASPVLTQKVNKASGPSPDGFKCLASRRA